MGERMSEDYNPATHCPWCTSTHIADAVCRCPAPCAVGWCAPPAYTEAEACPHGNMPGIPCPSPACDGFGVVWRL